MENALRNAAIEAISLRFGTFLNVQHINELANSLKVTKADLAKTIDTLEGMAEAITKLDMKGFDKLVNYLDDELKKLPNPTQAQSVEPSNTGFAVDRGTRDEIRYRFKIGVPVRRLAEDFNVSRTTIRRYINHNR